MEAARALKRSWTPKERHGATTRKTAKYVRHRRENLNPNKMSVLTTAHSG
jgi:hypothetical protein